MIKIYNVAMRMLTEKTNMTVCGRISYIDQQRYTVQPGQLLAEHHEDNFSVGQAACCNQMCL